MFGIIIAILTVLGLACVYIVWRRLEPIESNKPIESEQSKEELMQKELLEFIQANLLNGKLACKIYGETKDLEISLNVKENDIIDIDYVDVQCIEDAVMYTDEQEEVIHTTLLSKLMYAIRHKNIIVVTFRKTDKGLVSRRCIPYDFAPNSISSESIPRYQLLDIESTPNDIIGILEEDMIAIDILDENFEPKEYIKWNPIWHIPREW